MNFYTGFCGGEDLLFCNFPYDSEEKYYAHCANSVHNLMQFSYRLCILTRS
jgi:hypothetical protein